MSGTRLAFGSFRDYPVIIAGSGQGVKGGYASFKVVDPTPTTDIVKLDPTTLIVSSFPPTETFPVTATFPTNLAAKVALALF